MKILFAPLNIASMPATTCAALNKIDGIQSVYLSAGKHPYISDNQYRKGIACPVEYVSFKKNPFKHIIFKLFFHLLFKPYRVVKFCRWVIWADVVHWTGVSIFSFNVDLLLIKLLRKKRFVEWVGSDIRVPEVTMKESIWYKEAYYNGYEYSQMESKEKSYKLQEKFAGYGFVPILVPEMQLFLKPSLFPIVYTTQYRSFERAKQEIPYYPKLTNEKIIIVHSPSAKIAKGSNFIIAVINELKSLYPVEFILLHNIPRPQVLEVMKTCDIFIDQIILGSYASAAIEAMGYGKPVVAYIMPSVFIKGTPISCPIINANPDTLKNEMIRLIESPVLRNKIGIESRKYAEEIHDADKLAAELVKIYESAKQT